MKKVLAIFYYFPPNMAVASLRSRGLAKYLPEYGWEPIILTPAIPARSNSTFNFNVRLIETKYHDVITSWRKRLGLNPNRDVTIQRQLGTTGSNNSFNVINWLIKLSKEFIAYPDEQKGWYPFAIKAAEEFLQKESVDAIISSSNPVTSHLVAKHLKTKFNIPWVADLRDLWTQHQYYSHSFIRNIIERRLELKTLSTADMLVTVSKPWAEELRHSHGRKLVRSVPNGFDPEELVKSPKQLTTKFTITYTGILYGGKRDPSLLFRTVKELILKRNIDASDIEIRFYSPEAGWLENKIKLYRLQDIVKCYGKIQREKALEKQRESQLLLIVTGDNSAEKGMHTAKIFEYMAAQRPILAIGQAASDAIAELLKGTRAGVHASDPEDLKQVLLQWYREYNEKGRVGYQGCKDKIMKYSHKEMARKFAQILTTVSS